MDLSDGPIRILISAMPTELCGFKWHDRIPMVSGKPKNRPL